MKIDISYDASVNKSNFTGGASEESSFKSAMTYVVNELDSLFTNNVTINIDVGWGEYGGNKLGPGALGENSPSVVSDNYSTVETALVDTANASGDAVQLAAFSTLPTSDPTGGEGVDLSSAQAKALGLSGSSSGIDGYVGFNSSATWSFTHGVAPAAGAYYFVGVAEHEITEEMGRFSLPLSTSAAAYTVMDLFRYTAPGVRDTAPGIGPKGSTSYFSYDNGATKLGRWNNQNGNGDLGDWYPSGPAPQGNNSFNDFSNSGVINALTTTDVSLMNVLGWDTAFPSYEIPNGVTDWVAAGHSSAATIVLNGGYLEVGSGGTGLGTFVRSGGKVKVDHGGVADNSVISSGGNDIVDGTDVAALVDGGHQHVSAGGVATVTTLISGGYEYVSSGGTASSTIVDNGGYEYVSSGGKTHSSTVNSGGYEYVVSGGTASNTIVKNGGALEIESHGTARNATVDSGGVDYILAGGTASHTTVNSGGVEFVGLFFKGGTAIDTVVKGGGIEYVFGTTSGTTLSKGEEDVLSGGVASGTIVSSGGHEYIEGGTARGTTVETGGHEIASSGGTVEGATLSGGTLELISGSTAGSSTIVFAGGGKLKLDASTSFGGKISGFGIPDQLDLADIAFGRGTTLGFSEAGNNLSGTLTVTDGTKTADIRLLGQYMAGDFHMATDGSGGTLVTDPPLVAATDSNPIAPAAPHHV